MSRSLQLFALQPFPLVEPGDDIAGLVFQALAANELELVDGDVLVMAQKIVSKSENRYVSLADVEASVEARELAQQAQKDPRQVELILRESTAVVRVRPGVIIVEHQLGYVHANAGIDKSNIPFDEDAPQVLLLPADPDASARHLKQRLEAPAGIDIAVIINDSAGRAWRNGTIGFALGTAGIEPLSNQIGDVDLFGRELEVTEVAVADELAAAASFLMGQAAEACPVVLVRGAKWRRSSAGSSSLLRHRDIDMFR
jgi:coenzyme F420-0:L-glutamate ligase/coenzyme F420-1:gamma-L-glutamate ligase